MDEKLRRNVTLIIRNFRNYIIGKDMASIIKSKFEERGIEISGEEIEEALNWMLLNGYIIIRVQKPPLLKTRVCFRKRKLDIKKRGEK